LARPMSDQPVGNDGWVATAVGADPRRACPATVWLSCPWLLPRQATSAPQAGRSWYQYQPLFTRGGYDWADRFPAIVEAASAIKAQSFLIDGEAVVCRDDGVSDFDALRSRRRDHDVVLIAFDLIELQGDDLRNHKLIDRKNRLAKMLARGGAAIQFNEHLTHEGTAVFEHACRLGLEGIVSKRIDSPYRSGPSKVWLKSKNPASEAVRREREEDWDS
jgi:bifunctional non-homologous end joining protein LigD